MNKINNRTYAWSSWIHIAAPPSVRHFTIYCVIIFIICLLVGFSIAGERPELLNCRSMNKESFVKEFPESFIPENTSSGNLYLCRSESGSEFSSGNIPGGYVYSDNASSSAENASEIDTSKSAGRCNERPWTCLTESEKKKGQEVMYHVIGAILGLLIGSLIVIRGQRQYKF